LSARFAESGAAVVMVDLSPDVVQAAAELAAGPSSGTSTDRSSGPSPGFPRRVEGIVLDVCDQDAVHLSFRDLTERLGPVWCLVNNAGIVDQRPFEEIRSDQLDRMMRVNVGGTLYCCQGAAPGMKLAGDGRIVNLSSKSGKTGSALMAHYSAAKGAVISLTHALAYELAPHNIKVNSICPGIVDETGVWGEVSGRYTANLGKSLEDVRRQFTSKVPLGRLARIEDIVDFVLFLASSADYCTGQAFNISGGREMH
jgi:NAD(P)-dependent dehydrogenase (short-subunit alcohol dehydrogenase family)